MRRCAGRLAPHAPWKVRYDCAPKTKKLEKEVLSGCFGSKVYSFRIRFSKRHLGALSATHRVNCRCLTCTSAVVASSSDAYTTTNRVAEEKSWLMYVS